MWCPGAGRTAETSILRRKSSLRVRSPIGYRVVGLGALLLASDMARNPWSVARSRTAVTGALLAELIARTDDQSFILVGHSLGARVMVTAAQALGTSRPTTTTRR